MAPITVAFPPAREPLPETIVELAVGPDGDVFSAFVAESSGDAAADLEAMRAARSLRFQPGLDLYSASGNIAEWSLTWGRVQFRWSIATNRPPEVAQPPERVCIGKSTRSVADAGISSPGQAVVQQDIHFAVAVHVFRFHDIVRRAPEQRTEN